MRDSTPPASLLAALRPELARHAPFSEMNAPDVDFFLAHAQQRYFAPGETVLEPASGTVEEIYFVRSGAVTGMREGAEAPGLQYETGDLFPLGAAVARRTVTAHYRATADTFLLALPVAAMDELAARNALFADFLQQRIGSLLALSQRALQADYAAKALAEQSLETPLHALMRQPVASCGPELPLREVLARMQRLRIGSMLVVDALGHAQGILTRQDVLERVALPQLALDTPIAQVMVQPVHTLAETHTAQDAALLMSRQGIRHVPVTREGAVVGLVSERDLFALQRLSIKQVSTALRDAGDLQSLRALAPDIRRLAARLLGQGVQARQLTALVSHLNDVLTQRLLEITAAAHGVDLGTVCWLALGSEGRGEQTIATDQDNALVLADGTGEAQRQAAQAFAHAANQALADCGFPLCRGGVMAGAPGGCLTLAEWRERFRRWIAQGTPQDLLQACIYFDLRPLAGNAQLARVLQDEVLQAAAATPRFLKQLALQALAHGAPLNWLGAIETGEGGSIDLKMQGTALFVDAARIYALAQRVEATNTRERLEAAGTRLGVPRAEHEAWVGAFEFLQMLRLRVQLQGADGEHPNRLRVADLNDIDRRILKECFRVARGLQQRLHLDYER